MTNSLGEIILPQTILYCYKPDGVLCGGMDDFHTSD